MRSLSSLLSTASALALLPLLCTDLRADSVQQIELVSEGLPSGTADCASGLMERVYLRPAVVSSADGRYLAFASCAIDLVAGQQDQAIASSPHFYSDVFVHDLQTQTTTLVSHAPGSLIQATNNNGLPVAISSDGRWLLFTSEAPGLAAAGQDSNGGSDVWLHDRQTGGNLLVSHAAGATGTAANRPSQDASMSADGRYVVFGSAALNLVANMSNPSFAEQVYLFDRDTQTTELLSAAAGTASIGANARSGLAKVSLDGRYVSFASESGNLLVAQGPPTAKNLYVRDRTAQITLLGSRQVGTTTSGAGIIGTFPQSFEFPAEPPPALSDNGEVFFSSDSAALVQDDLPGADVYAFNIAAQTVRRISHAADHPVRSANGDSFLRAASPDGRWVLVVAYSDNLVAGQLPVQPPAAPVAYLYDRQADAFTLVSHAAAQPLQPVEGLPLLLSADGSLVAFESTALHALVAGSTVTTRNNVFAFQRGSGAVTLASHISVSSSTPGRHSADAAAVSADGQHLFFAATASPYDGALADLNQKSDVFDYSITTGIVAARSRSVGGQPVTANSYTSPKAISADGRWLLLDSTATNLRTGIQDDNDNMDVYLFDQQLHQHVLVSRSAAAAGRTGDGPSFAAALSENSRWVVLQSRAGDLVAGVDDNNVAYDVFLFDRETAQMRLLSLGAGGGHSGNGESSDAMASRDGQRVAYASTATDLVAGISDTGERSDVFVVDAASGQTRLVSRSAQGAQAANGSSTLQAISADGRWIVYASDATDLLSQPAPMVAGIYLYDSVSQNTQLLTGYDHFVDYVRAFGISDDGRWIGLEGTRALDPATLDLNGRNDVFLYDRVSAQATLVSRSVTPGRLASRSGATARSLSRDGRFVLYDSGGTDLVPGMAANFSGYSYVYVFDRALDSNILLSRGEWVWSPPFNAYASHLSDSGQYAFFAGAPSNEGQRIDLRNGSLLSVRGQTGGFGGAGAVTPNGHVVAVPTDMRPAVAGFRDNNGATDTYLSTLSSSGQRSSVQVIGTAPEPSEPGTPVTVTVRVTGDPPPVLGGSVQVHEGSGWECSDASGEPDGSGGLLFSCQVQPATAGITGVWARYDGSQTHGPSSSLVRHVHRVNGLDFGSAATSYGTALADNGPRHAVNSGLFIGAVPPDPESDGPAADSPDDQALFYATAYRSQPTTIALQASGSGFLNIFADFNRNGQFDLPQERWVSDLPVQRGENTLALTVPASARPGQIVTRTRLSSSSGLTHLGPAGDGEVEDAAITVENIIPVMNAPLSVSVREDVPLEVPITVLDADSLPGSLQVQALSGTPALVQSALGFPGSLPNQWIFTLRSGADVNSGTVWLLLQARDADNGLSEQSMRVDLVSVNDAPTFDLAGNLFLQNGSSGAFSQAGFAQNVVLGPANESGQQVLRYTLTELSDAAAVVSSASIDNDGRLHYVLSGSSGTASFEATLTDTGGTANGGVATSAPRYFSIVVQQNAELQVTNSNNSKALTPGQAVVYEMLVSNAGPHAATGLTLVHFVPAGLGSVSWTCSSVSLATCPLNAGADSILAALDLPAGGTLRYRVSARVTGAPGSRVRSTVSLLTPLHVVDAVPGNNDASDDDLIEGELLRDGFENLP